MKCLSVREVIITAKKDIVEGECKETERVEAEHKKEAGRVKAESTEAGRVEAEHKKEAERVETESTETERVEAEHKKKLRGWRQKVQKLRGWRQNVKKLRGWRQKIQKLRGWRQNVKQRSCASKMKEKVRNWLVLPKVWNVIWKQCLKII